MTTRQLKNLLKAHSSKNKKDDPLLTHTRIGDKENDIYGGKYIVKKEDEPEFYKAIYEEVIVGSKMEYLTERQYPDGPMYVDIDMRYDHAIATRQHNDDWISSLVSLYLTAIKEYFQMEGGEKMNVWILQKDGVNRLTDGSATKDGIHMIFAVNFPRKVQQLIRKWVIENSEELFAELPVKNEIGKILDEGITNGKTNVQLFGCRKPSHEAYKLYKVLACELDGVDMEWMTISSIPTMTPEIFWELSMRNTDRGLEWMLKEETKRLIDPMKKIKEQRDKKKPTADFENADETEKLFQCFTEKRIDDYETWIQIAWAIINSFGKERGVLLIEKLNEYCPKRNNDQDKAKAREWVEKQEPNFTESQVTVRSLHYWAKEDNAELYAELFPANNNVLRTQTRDGLIEAIIQTKREYSFAVYIKEVSEGRFVCINKRDRVFYEFSSANLWKEDRGATIVREYISNDVRQELQKKAADLYEEARAYGKEEKGEDPITTQLRNDALYKAESITQLEMKTLETNFKNNILTETCDKLIDVEFLKDMNKEQFVLPIRGGRLLNMKTFEITERKIQNKFDYECDAEYRELTDEETVEAQTYFLSLFCGRADTCQVVLDILKSVMTGRTLRYVYFFVGSGRNGKSVLLNLIRAMFKKGVDIISKDVVLKKKSNTHLNTEMEKLGKCRLGYTTEFKEEDELNETNLKAITGKDLINVRGIQRTDESLETTSNLAIITNELPSFKVEQAICDRLIVIPFNARFPIVDNFEDDIIAKRDIMFSYLMKRGVIRDKFELTDEMRAATDDYKKSNEKHFLRDFLTRTFELTNEKRMGSDKPMRVERDIVKTAYNQYLRELNESKHTISNTKLTKQVKDILKIDIQESGGKVYYLGIKWRKREEEDDAKP